MKKIIYFISLLVFAVALFIIIQYPNWQRMQLISGGLVSVGLALNLTAFFLKTEKLLR